jgi:hypothetical protein
LGCLWEWYSEDLLAIDAANEDQARSITAFLAGRQGLGHLVWEPGEGE